MPQNSRNTRAPHPTTDSGRWLTVAAVVAALASLLAAHPALGESTGAAAAGSVTFSSTGEVDQSFLLPADGPLLPRIRAIRLGSLPGHAFAADDAPFGGRR